MMKSCMLLLILLLREYQVNKMHPRSKKRRRSQEAEEKLTDATSTGLGGSASQTSTTSLCNSTNEEYISKNLDSDDTDDTDSESEEEDLSESENRKRKRGKSSYVKALENTLAVMAEQMKRRNDLLEQQMKMEVEQMEKSLKPEEDAGLLVECMKTLDEMEVDGASFTRFLNYLHDNPEYRKVFMVLSDSRRRKWVEILMKK
ncbi:hypothetical protein LINGRAHAP2_LOCUS421 [Linum grandiflorum]